MANGEETGEIDEASGAAKFFSSGWALTAVLTTLGPLHKLLDPVVPLVDVLYTNSQYGVGFMRVSSTAIRGAGILVSAIMFALTVSDRFEIMKVSYRAGRGRAVASFGFGMLVLIGYWLAYPNMPQIIQNRMLGTAAEVGLGVLYILFYMFMTRGFVQLSMNDYVNPMRQRNSKKGATKT